MGPRLSGRPEDDSSEASRLVGDMGDDPFHRYLFDSRGGWASASPRCYNITILRWIPLLRGRPYRWGRRGYSARLFSWHSWGRGVKSWRGKIKAIVIRVQTTIGPCANDSGLDSKRIVVLILIPIVGLDADQ